MNKRTLYTLGGIPILVFLLAANGCPLLDVFGPGGDDSGNLLTNASDYDASDNLQESRTYEYDADGRMIKEVFEHYQKGVAFSDYRTYEYDSDGNRTKESRYDLWVRETISNRCSRWEIYRINLRIYLILMG